MTEAPAASGEKRTRPFADVLRELDRGRVHADLSDKLQDLIAAVIDVRKAGSLSLTVKVDPTKTDAMVEVTGTVAVKVPKVVRASAFFVDDEHNLTRDNPRQPSLPLAGLPGGASDTDNPARSAR